MKKKILLLIGILALIMLGISLIMLFLYSKKEETRIEIELAENLTVNFLEEKKVSDFVESINGEIIDDFEIDTTSLGIQTIYFEFINDQNRKVSYTYQVEVLDVTPPTIFLGSNYKVKKGSSNTLLDDIFCGDDYDSMPICEIIGDYDLDTVGTYPVTFKATDHSGNSTEKNFNLIVYEPQTGSGSSSSETSYTYFEDVVAEYKTDKTKIGLDISKWQGDVDFNALKESGVEFVIIRVGSTRGTNGEYVLDPKFVDNIKGANEADIEVGLYFYSYADSIEGAKKDAKWLLQQIYSYQVALPIAFDWEEWSDFNEFHLSFYELTQVATSFLDIIEAAGYQGMLYSSKVYLENVWMPHSYEVWLAHYTTQTDYQGNYRFWQLCNNGKVDGIKGNVDIDILYLD